MTIPKLLQVPGVWLAALNIAGWGLVLLNSPQYVPMEAFLGSRAPGKTAIVFDEGRCWDCPAFRMLGREFFSVWDSFPAQAFLVANLPALFLSRGARDAMGTYDLNPPMVLLLSSAQWLLVGSAWRTWRTRRMGRAAGMSQ